MSVNDPLFAFFGTPRFAVCVLEALERRGLLPALVVTAPDKPRGRGLEVSPSPAALWARERGIDVITPATLRDEALIAELANSEWDIFAVAAYGKLLPQTILDLPQKGCLNIHPSLLPQLRGPSPARSAILADMRESGVSIMQMTDTMDAGPVVAQARIEISEEEWPPKGSMLEELLAAEGGALLAETLPLWLRGNITPEPQDESKATFTRKFSDEDALIDLSSDKQAREAFLKIRAFDASPRAHFFDAAGKRVIVTGASWKNHELEIQSVVPEGKKEMPYEDYRRASASM
jgi:methionyl-tRNA formyltransferase